MLAQPLIIPATYVAVIGVERIHLSTAALSPQGPVTSYSIPALLASHQVSSSN